MASLKIIISAILILVIINVNLTKAQYYFDYYNDGGMYDYYNYRKNMRRSGGVVNDHKDIKSQLDDSLEKEAQDYAVDSHERLFFASTTGRKVDCDYSTRKGISCYNCTELLYCKRNGGRVITCGQSRPYCTDGRCSLRQSDACVDAATTATTTEGATETTTTVPAETTTIV